MVFGDAVCSEVSYFLLFTDPKACQGWRVEGQYYPAGRLSKCASPLKISRFL